MKRNSVSENKIGSW